MRHKRRHSGFASILPIPVEIIHNNKNKRFRANDLVQIWKKFMGVSQENSCLFFFSLSNSEMRNSKNYVYMGNLQWAHRNSEISLCSGLVCFIRNLSEHQGGSSFFSLTMESSHQEAITRNNYVMHKRSMQYFSCKKHMIFACF